MAAQVAAPEDIPLKSLLLWPICGQLRRRFHLSPGNFVYNFPLEDVRHKPAPIPWIYAVGFASGYTGDAAGSTAMALNPGFFCFKTSATPVIVPPVPTPATRISTLPSVSARFFRGGQPVNFRIRRIFKLLRHVVIRIGGCHFFGFLIAPFIPSAPGVNISCAPKMERAVFSHGHCVRHRQDKLISPCGGDISQGDAGVPAGRFHDYGVLFN